jgi:hypothetical protein
MTQTKKISKNNKIMIKKKKRKQYEMKDKESILGI